MSRAPIAEMKRRPHPPGAPAGCDQKIMPGGRAKKRPHFVDDSGPREPARLVEQGIAAPSERLEDARDASHDFSRDPRSASRYRREAMKFRIFGTCAQIFPRPLLDEKAAEGDAGESRAGYRDRRERRGRRLARIEHAVPRAIIGAIESGISREERTSDEDSARPVAPDGRRLSRLSGGDR